MQFILPRYTDFFGWFGVTSSSLKKGFWTASFLGFFPESAISRCDVIWSFMFHEAVEDADPMSHHGYLRKKDGQAMIVFLAIFVCFCWFGLASEILRVEGNSEMPSQPVQISIPWNGNRQKARSLMYRWMALDESSELVDDHPYL